MNKTLVIFYSYTGTSRRVAQLLCSQLGWPSGEILEANPRAGVLGTLRCLADSMLRLKPLINYRGPDPKAFDTVVLVSPIWAYRLGGPMRTFVANHRAGLRQVAVLSVMGAYGAPNAVAEIGELLGRAPVLASAFTSREVDDGSCAARLEAFGRAVQDAREDAPPVRQAQLSPRAA